MEAGTVGKVRANEEYSDSQAGGHAGIMIFEGDRLLKKSKPNEILFVEWLCAQTSQLWTDFKTLAPRFYGIEEREGNKYVVMENLLLGYDHPNIMDCKLGRITWTSRHSEETIRNQEAKNKVTTTGSLGFRISGLVVKDSAGAKVEQLVKSEAFMNITESNIHEYFRKIVLDGDRIQTEVVQQFIEETERVKSWFERNTEKTFKASSVLFINGKNGKAQCRYIDLAHSEDAQGRTDENVLEGLQNVINIWRRLL
jgi:1D-myo-inositol-tetrakisphosphate 5-kinase/inositol-polyphosphate multikinase